MTTPPATEKYFYELRKAVKDFLLAIKTHAPESPIVEVGRMLTEGKVYDQFPEFYVDTKALFAGSELVHLDIDPATHPDVCCDIVDIDRHFAPASVGAVLLVHVLEHVTEFWKVPAKLRTILKPGGLVFAQTPWNFRFHGPRPDCWRISDDGYEALFKDQLTIVSLEKVNPFDDYLHPLVINVVLRKD
jgi:SAM-dependent methyltransferase